MEWLRSLWLGVVQGLTEFLPISSDGHLALFQILSAGPAGVTADEGAEHLFFDVMLHLGTALAILVHYRSSIFLGLRGLRGEADMPEEYRRPRLRHVALLVLVATLPLVPDALLFKRYFDLAFGSLWAAGVGFLVTASVLLLTTRLRGGARGAAEMTPLDALLIGLAQAFAPLPGVSRSGLTIATGLALGLTRGWAVGFSLMIAVPAIFGAAVFEARKIDGLHLSGERIAQIVAATALAGVVGYLAILWLVRVVRAGRLWYFSVYLIAVGGLTLVLASRYQPGGASDVGDTRAAERAARRGPVPAGPVGAPALRLDALDRADPRVPRPRPGLGRMSRPGAEGLDLG